MAHEYSHWPVLAWIRLRLPETPAPVQLTPGPPPPPEPPLEELAPEPVVTDPRRRVFSWTGLHDAGAIRIYWEADNPAWLTAEYREPASAGRPAGPTVRRFWDAVKRHTALLGPLPVEGADPYP